MLNETQMERTGEEGKPIMMTAKGKGRDRRGVRGGALIQCICLSWSGLVPKIFKRNSLLH